MGGGKREAAAQSHSSALNLQLPDARLKESASENKMSFYDEAEKESAKERKDHDGDLLTGLTRDDSGAISPKVSSPFTYNPYPPSGGSYKDPNEEKVFKKLAELNEQLSASSGPYNEKKGRHEVDRYMEMNRASKSADARRVDPRIANEGNENDDDSDMQHLNTMMDKIMDIQHPERVRERVKGSSAKGTESVLSLSSRPSNLSFVSLLDTAPQRRAATAAFYSLNSAAAEKEENAIEAVVHQTQTLVDGSTIKLRFLQDAYLNNISIPKGTFVFGTVSLSGERLSGEIHSVRVSNSLYPVKLRLFDMDGMEGLSVPGAITRDVAKGSVDNAAQLLEVTSLDPSLKAQATSAGLNAVKTLLAKKAKLVRVAVKDGYRVLLKNESSQ